VALSDGFKPPSYVGAVPLGIAPVGVAVSPDGRWLYATSESSATMTQGTLSVISLAKAERDPAHAVVATVGAHCSPVRVVVSSDGNVVWVTARESDQLLAFSAGKLRTDPKHALLAAVRVGESPVGLALTGGGRDVVVADSNRFGAPGARAKLTVVSAAAALAHRPAVLGTIRAGSFPREMALEPNGLTLLVGNFASDQLEAVAAGNLP
jgi:DNA-binding beta-propeller fold protein YncE